MSEQKIISEPARQTPVYREVDVLVVGGGPAGITAAIAAAEGGAKVMLAESKSFLGGNLTIGIPILGFLSRKGQPIIKGLPQKLIDRLKAVGAASEHQTCPLHVSITIIDPEIVKTVAMDMLLEAGVEILFYAHFADPVLEGDRIVGAVFQTKGGREAILAREVIDCTGDGDVAFQAGAPCEKGGPDGGMQPPTLMFRMDRVDTDTLRRSIAERPAEFQMDVIPPEYFASHPRFITVGLRNLIDRARSAGIVVDTDRTIIITGMGSGEAWINMTRLRGVDGSEAADLTRGEIATRGQIADLVRYLVGFVPGFESAVFSRTAPFLGIRESRRVVGRYLLNRDDILSCRRFEDAIAVGSYPIDLHHPGDNDCTMEWCEDCYDIPYRSLLPKKIVHLLVAGRCSGTTHEAMAATRVMSTCMALGEAAGRAAAIAVRRNVPSHEVDPREVRDELLKHGAYLR